ncbi:MAG: ABC transporter ATP-binding protein [Chloroflexota bacterium]|nr:ABC transporter ATP-binding protein [Chloroflexota bacterium]
MGIIETRGLTKRFKDVLAVDRVDLEIEEGECFGLLGPNGAGKTSLIRMITAVSPVTAGEIWVQGKNLDKCAREAKAIMGVVPQMDNLDPDLTVLQNLLTFARYFDIPKREARRRSLELLELFKLEDRLNARIRELSGGMKRRLLVGRGLINQPRILILDEPTIGLDPQARYLVWHKLAQLNSEGVTRILCTHNMEEATVLCDRVAVMNEGRILSLGAPRRLISEYAGDAVWEIDVRPDAHEAIVQELERRGLDFEDSGTQIHVFHADSDESLREVVSSPDNMRRRPATLEDVFFRLTGRSLVE